MELSARSDDYGEDRRSNTIEKEMIMAKIGEFLFKDGYISLKEKCRFDQLIKNN